MKAKSVIHIKKARQKKKRAREKRKKEEKREREAEKRGKRKRGRKNSKGEENRKKTEKSRKKEKQRVRVENRREEEGGKKGKRKRALILTYCRAWGLVRFVQFAFIAEGHHNRRQNDDLIPRYEDGPRKRHERAALELKRHGAAAIDQDVEPDRKCISDFIVAGIT